MLPSPCGLGQHFHLLGHSFSLNEPTSRAVTSGGEIMKKAGVTSPIIISFYSGAERCKKIKKTVDIDNSR